MYMCCSISTIPVERRVLFLMPVAVVSFGFIGDIGTKLGTIKRAETRGQSRLSLAESFGF